MLARKIFFYLLPPVVIGCIIGGVYLSHRQDAVTEEGEMTQPPIAQPIEMPGAAPPVSNDIGSVAAKNTSGSSDAEGSLPSGGTPAAILTTAELLEVSTSFSDSPVWAQLLAQTTPVTRIVKAIDAVANGQRPVDALDFLHVDTAFQAQKNANGNWVATAETYARYQSAVDFLVGTPTEDIAKWFELAEPVLQQSCRQLGYQDKSIRDLIGEAIQTILDVPQFATDPVLVPTGTSGTYHFVDPVFEQLNDAQKLFVRLGPENCAKIQAKCRSIADALKLYR